jgi:hypothetical protein
MAPTDLADESQRQAHRIRRLGGADEHGVSDDLHLLGVVRSDEIVRLGVELVRQIRCVLVAHRLCEGREAGEVGEQERLEVR